MVGVYRIRTVVILQYEGQESPDSKRKAEMLVKALKSFHNSGNIFPKSKSRMEEKLKNNNFKLH